MSDPRIVIILPEQNFEAAEVEGFSRIFDSYGLHLTFATPSGDDARSFEGVLIPADCSVGELSVDDFDVLIVIGCSGSFPRLDQREVTDLVLDAWKDRTVVGVCEAVKLFAHMGMLQDCSVAAPEMIRPAIREEVGDLSGDQYCRCGNLYTVEGPDTVATVAEELVTELVE